MGCPPDPVEIGISRDNTATQDAEQKFIELGAQKETALKLFHELKAGAFQNEQVEIIVNAVTAGTHEAKVAPPEFSTYGMYADAHEASAKRTHAEQKAKNREDSLCIIRDGILKLAAFIPEKILQAKRDAFEKEKELHRLHREDDRETWLHWLADRINLLSYYKEKAEAQKSDPAYFIEALAKIEREVERVKCLSTDALLSNRDIIGRNPSEFEADYSKIRHLRL
jgi:hypothetical protein